MKYNKKTRTKVFCNMSLYCIICFSFRWGNGFKGPHFHGVIFPTNCLLFLNKMRLEREATYRLRFAHVETILRRCRVVFTRFRKFPNPQSQTKRGRI